MSKLHYREKDYSHLEGRTVKWGYKHVLCHVDACEYDIGITISELGNPERRICCLTNSDNVSRDSAVPLPKKIYDALFICIVRGIAKGVLDEYNTPFEEILKIGRFNYREYGDYIPADKCAFSQ